MFLESLFRLPFLARLSLIWVFRGSKFASAEDELKDILNAFQQDNSMLWGAATASYQVEGAWNADGKQPSNWDVWMHANPNHDNGDVADDFYHLWSSDIDRLVDLGFNAFRLSISWLRILPLGVPNLKGVQFYLDVFEKLVRLGIEPIVTLYHWDLPDNKDWLIRTIVNDFANYANFCFKSFGHLVKRWLTLNEPSSFTSGDPFPYNSSKQRYLCGHHALLAHAAAVKVYREGYKHTQGGQIGITLDYNWAEPYDVQNESHRAAAQLHHDFHLGWFADPIYLTGDYPKSMRAILGDALPHFSAKESELLRGSFDFYGMNHYSTAWVRPSQDPSQVPAIETTFFRDNGTAIGPQAASDWLYEVPWGIERTLHYIHSRYPAVKSILITENGVDVPGEGQMQFPKMLDDQFRVNYFRKYLSHVARAKVAGVPVHGYFAWSLLDNLEWKSGFQMRFGLHYVNFSASPPTRHVKKSALWFKHLLSMLHSHDDSNMTELQV